MGENVGVALCAEALLLGYLGKITSPGFLPAIIVSGRRQGVFMMPELSTVTVTGRFFTRNTSQTGHNSSPVDLDWSLAKIMNCQVLKWWRVRNSFIL